MNTSIVRYIMGICMMCSASYGIMRYLYASKIRLLTEHRLNTN